MRDYYQQPLKRGELIPKEDIEEIFIKNNNSLDKTCKIFNISYDILHKHTKLYNLKKTKEQILEIRKKSNLQKYGVEFASQLPEKQEKMSKGLRKRYNNKELKTESNEKRNKTMLKKYGIDNPMKLKEVWDKIKKNNLEKYGVEFVTSTKEHKQKVKQSVKEKYGVDNVSQLTNIKNKKLETFKNTFDTPEKLQAYKEKVRQTNLKRYGAPTFAQSKFIDWNKLQEKRYNTLKKNKSFVISKDEKIILQKLKSKFKDVQTNYKSEQYPFHCDFYIKELNLYIEYNGHISHGLHPFSVLNNKDLLLFNKWLKRSQEINFKNKKKDAYKLYLHVWVIRDRKKRKTARENNLNWIEFFSLQEFETWFNKL